MLLDEFDGQSDSPPSKGAENGPVHHHRHSRPKEKEDDMTELLMWVGGGILVVGVAAGGYMVVDNINKQRNAQQQLLMQQQKQQAQPNTLQQQRESQMMDTDRQPQVQPQTQIPMENPQFSQGYYANSMRIDTPEPTGEVPELEHTLTGYADINTGQHERETHGQIRNTLPDNPRLNPPEPTEEPPKKRYKDSAVDIYCPSF